MTPTDKWKELPAKLLLRSEKKRAPANQRGSKGGCPQGCSGVFISIEEGRSHVWPGLTARVEHDYWLPEPILQNEVSC